MPISKMMQMTGVLLVSGLLTLSLPSASSQWPFSSGLPQGSSPGLSSSFGIGNFANSFDPSLSTIDSGKSGSSSAGGSMNSGFFGSGVPSAAAKDAFSPSGTGSSNSYSQTWVSSDGGPQKQSFRMSVSENPSQSQKTEGFMREETVSSPRESSRQMDYQFLPEKGQKQTSFTMNEVSGSPLKTSRSMVASFNSAPQPQTQDVLKTQSFSQGGRPQQSSSSTSSSSSSSSASSFFQPQHKQQPFLPSEAFGMGRGDNGFFKQPPSMFTDHQEARSEAALPVNPFPLGPRPQNTPSGNYQGELTNFPAPPAVGNEKLPQQIGGGGFFDGMFSFPTQSESGRFMKGFDNDFLKQSQGPQASAARSSADPAATFGSLFQTGADPFQGSSIRNLQLPNEDRQGFAALDDSFLPRDPFEGLKTAMDSFAFPRNSKAPGSVVNSDPSSGQGDWFSNKFGFPEQGFGVSVFGNGFFSDGFQQKGFGTKPSSSPFDSFRSDFFTDSLFNYWKQ